MKDTRMQWDLIAAAVETAAINILNLGKEEAKRMRGRYKVTVGKNTKRLLRGIADEEEDADLFTRTKWLRVAAGHHTAMANKRIMVARYMLSKKVDNHRTVEIILLTHKTAIAYKELAGRLSKRGKLTQH